MSEEIKVRRLMALLEREFGPVEGAKPKLTIVKDLVHTKAATSERPAIFASGLLEARRKSARG
ncbi:hypothetical protein RHOFW510R12_01405 [Rhodanobacter sp. FW510-R12]|nr:hypothetical protein RHOFW104R8_13440 [Rhodanobacter sp. FW104-R8]KZC28563.1 hypothetical protein RhoFW510T8_10680 [Rhodanobacter sp. FW510-T8]KZC32335.1 hypothetical protein RhoFW510R10_12950 [Rhodanobacter sp. FW510-R10]